MVPKSPEKYRILFIHTLSSMIHTFPLYQNSTHFQQELLIIRLQDQPTGQQKVSEAQGKQEGGSSFKLISGEEGRSMFLQQSTATQHLSHCIQLRASLYFYKTVPLQFQPGEVCTILSDTISRMRYIIFQQLLPQHIFNCSMAIIPHHLFFNLMPLLIPFYKFALIRIFHIQLSSTRNFNIVSHCSCNYMESTKDYI